MVMYILEKFLMTCFTALVTADKIPPELLLSELLFDEIFESF